VEAEIFAVLYSNTDFYGKLGRTPKAKFSESATLPEVETRQGIPFPWHLAEPIGTLVLCRSPGQCVWRTNFEAAGPEPAPLWT
jgi:hypothetical protein